MTCWFCGGGNIKANDKVMVLWRGDEDWMRGVLIERDTKRKWVEIRTDRGGTMNGHYSRIRKAI